MLVIFCLFISISLVCKSLVSFTIHTLFTTIECVSISYSHYICYFSSHRAYLWCASSNSCDEFCYHVWYNPDSPSAQSLPTCYFWGHKSCTFWLGCLQGRVSQFYLNTYTLFSGLYEGKSINKYAWGISCFLFFVIFVFGISIHFSYLAYTLQYVEIKMIRF